VELDVPEGRLRPSSHVFGQTRNQLTGIEAGYDSGCCRECDGRAQFYTSKVPVVYVKVMKIPE